MNPQPTNTECCEKCHKSWDFDTDTGELLCENPKCSCHSTPNTEWRDNIHKTIKRAIYGNQDIGLAQVIIDGIDAAYAAGLDDKLKHPMGVSQWQNYGIDNGYWEYFENKVLSAHSTPKEQNTHDQIQSFRAGESDYEPQEPESTPKELTELLEEFEKQMPVGRLSGICRMTPEFAHALITKTYLAALAKGRAEREEEIRRIVTKKFWQKGTDEQKDESVFYHNKDIQDILNALKRRGE